MNYLKPLFPNWQYYLNCHWCPIQAYISKLAKFYENVFELCIIYHVMVLYRLSKRVILTFLSYYLTLFGITSLFWYYITLFSVLPHPFGIIFTLFPYYLILVVLFSHFSSYYFTFLGLFPHFHRVIVDSSKPRTTPGWIQNVVCLTFEQLG